AAADGDDERRLGGVNGGFCFLEKFQRLGADVGGVQVHGECVDRSLAAWMSGELIGAEGHRLKRCEPWSSAGKGGVGSRLALKHRRDKNQFAAFTAEADAIANHSLPEYGGEFGGEVADLIGVRKEDEIGFCRFDYLF